MAVLPTLGSIAYHQHRSVSPVFSMKQDPKYTEISTFYPPGMPIPPSKEDLQEGLFEKKMSDNYFLG